MTPYSAKQIVMIAMFNTISFNLIKFTLVSLLSYNLFNKLNNYEGTFK